MLNVRWSNIDDRIMNMPLICMAVGIQAPAPYRHPHDSQPLFLTIEASVTNFSS